MTNNKLSIFTVTVFLAGCGGGTDEKESTRPPVGSTPVNQAPVLTNIDPLTAFSKTDNIIVLNATDPDDDVLTYSAVSSDQGVVLDLDNTNLTLTSRDEFYGMAEITVTVSDNDLTDSSLFTIEILQASIPPAPSSDNSQLSTPPSIPSL